MQLIKDKKPYLRSDFRFSSYIGDAAFAFIPLIILAWYYYGWRSTVICLISATVSYLADILCALIMGKKPMFSDISSVVTGLVIAMMLPVSIPYYVVITADIVAIVLAKAPFGGLGHNVFNPACVGFIFVTLCWSDLVFKYVEPFTKLPVLGSFEAEYVNDIAGVLHLGGTPTIEIQEALYGNVAGAIGTCGILVLCTCMLFLLVRGVVKWYIPFGMLLSVCLIAYFFPRCGLDSVESIKYELLSGTVIFGAVFIINDPVTSPKRKISRFIYGLGIGALTMIARKYCSFEVGLPFAVVIMNIFSYSIDSYVYRISYVLFHKRYSPKLPGYSNFAIGGDSEEEASEQ